MAEENRAFKEEILEEAIIFYEDNVWRVMPKRVEAEIREGKTEEAEVKMGCADPVMAFGILFNQPCVNESNQGEVVFEVTIKKRKPQMIA